MAVLPFQASQAELMIRAHAISTWDWPGLIVANLVLLAGACALAADFPLAQRQGRAVLVGIAVPLLLPGPTVVDGIVHDLSLVSGSAGWLPLALPSVLLLMMLGAAEAGIYLLATRPHGAAERS